ncbi:MAG: hypothetical protein WBE26_11440, partial [Phycisphaerae bacterium]
MKHPYSTAKDPAAMILSMKVGDKDGPPRLSVDVMIDTGAGMTALPKQLLGELGVKPAGCVPTWGAFDTDPEERPTFFVKLQRDRGRPIVVEVLAKPGR